MIIKCSHNLINELLHNSTTTATASLPKHLHTVHSVNVYAALETYP